MIPNLEKFNLSPYAIDGRARYLIYALNLETREVEIYKSKQHFYRVKGKNQELIKNQGLNNPNVKYQNYCNLIPLLQIIELKKFTFLPL